MDDLQQPFDLVVIGAGINGLGIARDAAVRGLRVVLLEQDDICSGVSAWSGRLVHGGLRYLEHHDVALVRESLRERERLFRLAPHLVKPLRLLMPMYRHNRRSPRLIRLGMVVYDLLSFDKRTSRHEILGTEATVRRFTGIGRDGLTGAAVFTDGQVEYAERLCVEVAVAAAAAGARIRTKARVEEPVLEGGRVVGVRYLDTTTGTTHEVRGDVVLNVAGPWIDRVLRRGAPEQPRLNGGTKGSHLVVDPFPGAPTDVVYYESRRDGRLVLVIPWMGRYLIGTTDLRFEDDPDLARCTQAEMDYLLGEVNELVPDARLTADDVLFTYSGVRPLPYAPGVPESKVPRSHVLHDHAPDLPNFVTVVGGKLTTYRQLAQDAVDDVFRRLGRTGPRCVTEQLPLPGAGDAALSRTACARAGLSRRSTDRLVDLHGSRAIDVVTSAGDRRDLLAAVHEPTGTIAAQILWTVDQEFARTLTDVLARRVLLAFEPDHGLAALDAVTDLLAQHLGWDADERKRQVEEYLTWLERLAVPGRPSARQSLSSPAAGAAS